MGLVACLTALIGLGMVVAGVHNPRPTGLNLCPACGFRIDVRGAVRCPECGLLLSRRPGLTGVGRRTNWVLVACGLLVTWGAWAWIGLRAVEVLR